MVLKIVLEPNWQF